jgi:hypothetical protein
VDEDARSRLPRIERSCAHAQRAETAVLPEYRRE